MGVVLIMGALVVLWNGIKHRRVDCTRLFIATALVAVAGGLL